MSRILGPYHIYRRPDTKYYQITIYPFHNSNTSRRFIYPDTLITLPDIKGGKPFYLFG
jgi:hypothetical protein